MNFLRRKRWACLATIITVAVWIAACSGKSNNSGFGDNDAGGDGSSPDSGLEDVVDLFDTKQDNQQPGAKCSGDLHNVIDDQGTVIAVCPPDQGCAGGKCIPACDAAAASKGNLGCDFVVATPSFF